MRKGLLLTAVLGVCLSVSSLADERLPKYLIDGYFFNELPFDMVSQPVETSSSPDQMAFNVISESIRQRAGCVSFMNRDKQA